MFNGLTKRLIFICITSLFQVMVLQAQTAVKDSIRIENDLPDKDMILIDPELRIYIHSDSLRLRELINFELRMDRSNLQISKDFSEYLFQENLTDTTTRILLPTYLLHQYGLYAPLIEDKELGSFKIHPSDIEELKALDMQNGGTFRFSAEDGLRRIFWKSERAKLRNRKYANAYKFYHGFP